MDKDALAIDRKTRRFRRPSTVWGWLVWLLIALLFFLLISYVLVPWWYQPAPSDMQPDIPRPAMSDKRQCPTSCQLVAQALVAYR